MQSDRIATRFAALFMLVFAIVAPPGVPADRLSALRDAFNAAVNSPALRAEAGKLKLDIELVTAAEIEKLIASAWATPAPVIERLKKAMTRAN